MEAQNDIEAPDIEAETRDTIRKASDPFKQECLDIDQVVVWYATFDRDAVRRYTSDRESKRSICPDWIFEYNMRGEKPPRGFGSYGNAVRALFDEDLAPGHLKAEGIVDGNDETVIIPRDLFANSQLYHDVNGYFVAHSDISRLLPSGGRNKARVTTRTSANITLKISDILRVTPDLRIEGEEKMLEVEDVRAEPVANDTQEPNVSATSGKRGPAPIKDTKHFEAMDRLLESGKATSKAMAATIVVDDGDVEGASRDAKITRLRKNYPKYIERKAKLD